MGRLSVARRWFALAALGGALVLFVVLRLFVLPKRGIVDDKKFQQQILQALSQKTNLSAEMPWMERLEDADLRRTIQPDFYRRAQTGDLVIHFSDRLILYRAQTGEILADFSATTTSP